MSTVTTFSAQATAADLHSGGFARVTSTERIVEALTRESE
ncbi:hypothetical protein JOF45_001223 [Nesterenkonia lacusekhoensis]|uniref:Uncharacterized protein n=1 Tax=Nesterenkonia lacusekhoensis TaxID=150832 RepID=A0ABS4T2F9_9MICC|nr:hypothetical protein [Nesterenkonia lacusekhoensis]